MPEGSGGASAGVPVRADGDSDQPGGSGEEWMHAGCDLVVKSKGLGCARHTAEGEGGTETKFTFLTCTAGWRAVSNEDKAWDRVMECGPGQVVCKGPWRW